MKNWLYFATVMHSRRTPIQHRFAYKVFYLCFPLKRLGELKCPLFSVNRFNLFSFDTRDHGARTPNSPLPLWIIHQLQEFGLDTSRLQFELQAAPRILGYVFNPVSFWYCQDFSGSLRAVMAEVNNTFGERHNYLVAHEDARPIQADDWLTARKIFHVSPFLPTRGTYRFNFQITPHCRETKIDFEDESGTVLRTAIRGQAHPLNSLNLLRALLMLPLGPFTTNFRIHYQAFRLWTRGVPFFSKPRPPESETTRC